MAAVSRHMAVIAVCSPTSSGSHRAQFSSCPARLGGPQLQRPASSRLAASSPDIDSLLDGLDVPDIEADLADFQAQAGAVFDDAGVAVSFGNDRAAFEAWQQGTVVVDRSHWGRLRLSGPDRQSFLHGQSTADINALQPGSGGDTVLVTPQARTIDLVTVYVQGSGLLLVVSPGMAGVLTERLSRYIFPGDEVAVTDITRQTAMLCLLGPGSEEVLAQLQAAELVGRPVGSHTVLGFGGRPVIAAVGGGLPGGGYTLICDEAVAGDLWRALTSRGAVPMGSAAWEAARVVAGRPSPGAELTEEFNAFEAGLYQAVSLDKGCYIGQETLAKVHTKGALRRELWGLELEAPCAVGDEVRAAPPPAPLPSVEQALAEAAAKVAGQQQAPASSQPETAPQKALGSVTSAVDVPTGGHRALAYLRCKQDGKAVALEGARVVVGGTPGQVVALPFATRTLPAGGGSNDGAAAAEAAALRQREEEEAAEAERRADKLRQMQERLAAWQASQGGQAT